MRIRSTKPEFWRSETIAALDWEARLILKGVEAYVDDNGVGKDSVTLICADVFPHDLARDPETVARVARGLEALCAAQILVRYTMAGERLIYVRRWKALQRVDKPNKGRYPRPDGTIEYSEKVDETVCAGQGAVSQVSAENSGDPREDVASISGDPRETPAPGTEEQRNRGTEEEKTCPSAPPLDEPDPPAAKPPRRMSRRDDDPEGFAEFWAAYPRREGRGAAVKAYIKARKKASAQEILDGVGRYVAENPNRETQYTAHPATWLNGDRWQDELARRRGGTASAAEAKAQSIRDMTARLVQEQQENVR